MAWHAAVRARFHCPAPHASLSLPLNQWSTETPHNWNRTKHVAILAVMFKFRESSQDVLKFNLTRNVKYTSVFILWEGSILTPQSPLQAIPNRTWKIKFSCCRVFPYTERYLRTGQGFYGENEILETTALAHAGRSSSWILGLRYSRHMLCSVLTATACSLLVITEWRPKYVSLWECGIIPNADQMGNFI